MKHTKHIRTKQEQILFTQNLEKWDFVQSPMTFIYSPYRDSRTLEQYKKMWAMLTDISRQKERSGKLRSPEDWKDLFTASIKMAKQQTLEAVPGLEGGVVILGLHTSKMSVEDMSELIEYMYSWGADNEIEWTE